MSYEPLLYEASYVQPQDSAGCGRHALNNLLGGTYFIRSIDQAYTLDEIIAIGRGLSKKQPMDLQRVCRYLAAKPKYDDAITCPVSENYLADVLSVALRAAGFSVNILYRTKNGELPVIPDAAVGYIINYGRGHWVALHKNDGRFTYKNSINDTVPKRDEATKVINQFTEKSNSDLTKQTGLYGSEEAAIAAAIAKSLEATAPTTFSPVGTRKEYNDMAAYLHDYGPLIYAILVVGERSEVNATKLFVEENAPAPATASPPATATAPPPAPATATATAPPPAPPPAPATATATASVTAPAAPAPVAPDMVNIFTGKIVPPAIIALTFAGPETLTKADSLTNEIDFLKKLGLAQETDDSVIIDPSAAVLYAEDGVFSEVLLAGEETWNITKIWNFLSGSVKAPTPVGKGPTTALKKYLFLMRDIILPRRIAKLSGLSSLSTETEAGRRIQTELNEMQTYLTRLKEIV